MKDDGAKKKLFPVGVFLFLILCAVANPDVNLHKEKINDHYKADNPLTGIFGVGN
jgi:hypothetical protein